MTPIEYILFIELLYYVLISNKKLSNILLVIREIGLLPEGFIALTA